MKRNYFVSKLSFSFASKLIPIIKKIEVNSYIDTIDRKIRSNIINTGKNRIIETDDIFSKDPMESIIIALNICKIKTIQHFFSENKNYLYDKIEVSSKTEFDFDRYLFPDKLGENNKKRPINFSYIEVMVKIKINNSNNKIKKEEINSKNIDTSLLSKELETFSNRCPVYNVLKAGVNVDKKIIIDI